MSFPQVQVQEGPVVVPAVVHEAVALFNGKFAVLREAAAAVCELAGVLRLAAQLLKSRAVVT